MALDRRQALWQLRAIKSSEPLPLFQWSDTREAGTEPDVALPEMPLSEHVLNDYQALRLSLKAHPLSFLRAPLNAGVRKRRRVKTCAELQLMRDGQWVEVAGLVLIRQRPGSAKGVVFMTIEDETGVANVVIWSKTLEKFRKQVMGARLILVSGRVQRHEDIIHVVSVALRDKSDLLWQLTEEAQEFAGAGAQNIVAKSAMHTSKQVAIAQRTSQPARGHPRNARIIPKSRDFH